MTTKNEARTSPQSEPGQESSVRREADDTSLAVWVDAPHRAGRSKLWCRYPTAALAEQAAHRLRALGMAARVEPNEPPEHGGQRRRFIVWAVLCGFAKPERLTEAVVREIEAESTL